MLANMGRSEIASAEPAALESFAPFRSSDCRLPDELVDPSGRLPHVSQPFALATARPGRFLVRFPIRIVRRRRARHRRSVPEAPHRRVRGFHVDIACRGYDFDIQQSAFRRAEEEGSW